MPGGGLIEHADQRHAFAGEDRLDQFQIAHGDGIERHGLRAVVIRRAVQMLERRALRVAQIVQYRARGAHRGGASGQSAAIERQQSEVIAQRAVRVVEAEHPRLRSASGRLSLPQRAGAATATSISRAARGFPAHAAASASSTSVTRNSPVEISTCAIPAREPLLRHRREIVVLMRAQQVRIGRRARRDDAGDLAADQFLARPGLFHLLADGHAIALLDQPRDVTFRRVIGHAAHRNRVALFLVARGERDFEFARGGNGVFEEQLVEVAQPEHQQRVGNLLLRRVVLPHQRRRCLSH